MADLNETCTALKGAVQIGTRIMVSSTNPGYPLSDEDARRLVACWNACKGVPTEALEAGVVRKALADMART
jgi:hypothetical protein